MRREYPATSAARMAASLRSDASRGQSGAPQPRGPNRSSAFVNDTNGKDEQWHSLSAERPNSDRGSSDCLQRRKSPATKRNGSRPFGPVSGYWRRTRSQQARRRLPVWLRAVPFNRVLPRRRAQYGSDDEPVVSTDLPDPSCRTPPGRAGVHHHPPGLPARHLDRWRADRTRDDMSNSSVSAALTTRAGSKWTR